MNILEHYRINYRINITESCVHIKIKQNFQEES